MIRLLALKTLGPLAGRYPRPWYWVASFLGWLGWRLMPRQRARVLKNLLPFCDGDRILARQEGVKVFENVCRYWVDLVSMPYRDMSEFERRHLTIDYPARLDALSVEGPVVAVSAHTGNAELAVQALTWRGRPYVALVERLEPPSVAQHVADLRTTAGGTFHETDFQGLKALVAALRRGEIIGLMGDRDLQGTGVCAKLAGREVRLPRGPWELARRARALVVPIFTTRLHGDRFALHIEEPFMVPLSDDEQADIEMAVNRFAAILEAHIRREPGQWAVLEDYWRVHACG